VQRLNRNLTKPNLTGRKVEAEEKAETKKAKVVIQ
jgi:hypothetical protein